MIERFRRSPDAWAIIVLSALWLLFFWRFYTPNEIDAVSLQEGDFSSQFVAWTSYNIERVQEHELPLWNPYMNAGAPFLADPQTAALYPPRLLTVSILATGNWIAGHEVYQALQIEMTLHVLLGVLLMYIFLRRITTDLLQQQEVASQIPSIASSMIGAITFGFGGFMSAYPQLQLPLLETAIWIPLVLLGIHEATRGQTIGWRCIVMAGVALGLSVLAGHPQTFLFTGYISVAYLAYRAWHHGWRTIGLAIVLFGVVTGGLTTAQWLPSLEFQAQTYREDLSVDEKGLGFAMQDLAQLLFPDLLGRWSPLYVGIVGLVLIGIAIWRHGHRFWTTWATFGLILSFGEKTVVYNLVYLLLPGFSFFRGQERAAFIVAFSSSILIAFGAIHLLTWNLLSDHKPARQLRRAMIGLVTTCVVFALVFFFLRLIPPNGELYQTAVQASIFTLMMAIATLIVLSWVIRQPNDTWRVMALIGLVVFDLFSINMNNSNYEPIPADKRLPEASYVQTIRNALESGQRVEGLRGIRDSYGTLYRIPDIWGNSPLRAEVMEFFLWQIPIERRWELLAVQVVNSEWESIPGDHTIIGSGDDIEGLFNVFRLDKPRPFAQMMFQVQSVQNATEARELVKNPEFSLRDKVILEENLGDFTQGTAQVNLTVFEPEYIEITTDSDTKGVLSLSLPYLKGWQASIDGIEAELLRAYGGLSAVVVESGSHKVVLKYRPLTFQVGSIISIITLVLIVLSVFIRLYKESSDALSQ